MQIGIHSFAAVLSDPATGIALSPADRLAHLIEEAELADRAGIDVFAIGEHHRAEFLDAAPNVLLAAMAARTERIRLTSGVTVLSATDPVRVFQEFATIDLLSRGRAEIIVGRGSFVEAFPLFGLRMEDYDAVFAEKLDLLLKLRAGNNLHWSGRFRPSLTGQAVFPRPMQAQLPISLGAGGTPQSFIRAGTLGLPLMIGIISGTFRQFRPLVDLYRAAWNKAGHPPEGCKVGINTFGLVADTAEAAREAFYPGWQHLFGIAAKERGWPRPTRAQFDAACGPEGTYLIGDPQTVAARAIAASEVLGGVSRISLQIGVSLLRHRTTMHAIDLLGAKVAPVVRLAAAGDAAPPRQGRRTGL